MRTARFGGQTVPVTDELDPTAVEAPIETPSKIIGCLGNDVGRDGDGVDLFLKAPSSLVGPSGKIMLPLGAKVVPECELAVVIGIGGRHIRAADALDHVAGYSIALDLTARGPQDRSRRKSHDTFCPLGPWLVTADEVLDPQVLDVRLLVDGELHQDWSTSRMLATVAEVIALASSEMQLRPGDLLLTGAPPMTVVLAPGQTVEAEITGLGRLTMHVVSA